MISPITASSEGASPYPLSAATTPDTSYSPAPTEIREDGTEDEKKKNRTCPICFKYFKRRPADMIKHIQVHQTERPYKCDYDSCPRAFRTDKKLQEHVNYNHLNLRKFTCKEQGCNAAFNTSSRLRRHQNQVHVSGIRCSQPGCNKRFRNKNTCERHIRKEHEGLLPFTCNIPNCHEAFADANSRNRHVTRNHGTKEHWCTQCNQQFTSRENLAHHCKKFHVSCPFCDLIFTTRDKMQAHTEVEHGNSSEDTKVVQCPDCPKTYSKASNMTCHHLTTHQGHRFICGQADVSSYAPLLEGWRQSGGCHLGFTTKIKLVEHIRFTHLGQARPISHPRKPSILEQLSGTRQRKVDASYQCCEAQCGRKFRRITDLEKHNKSHVSSPQEAPLIQQQTSVVNTVIQSKTPLEDVPALSAIADFKFPCVDALRPTEGAVTELGSSNNGELSPAPQENTFQLGQPRPLSGGGEGSETASCRMAGVSSFSDTLHENQRVLDRQGQLHQDMVLQNPASKAPDMADQYFVVDPELFRL